MIHARLSVQSKSPESAMAGEIVCPCCRKTPILPDLTVLLIDLMNERGLTENAQSVLEALYLAAGRPVLAEKLFDRMYDHDPDGGPSPARMYADLNAALAELNAALDCTGLAVVRQGRRDGWRLILTPGDGAYVSKRNVA